MLINDDLPTLDRPINAYSGFPSVGHFEISVLDITNAASLIFTANCFCKDRDLTNFDFFNARFTLYLFRNQIDSYETSGIYCSNLFCSERM